MGDSGGFFIFQSQVKEKLGKFVERNQCFIDEGDGAGFDVPFTIERVIFALAEGDIGKKAIAEKMTLTEALAWLSLRADQSAREKLMMDR